MTENEVFERTKSILAKQLNVDPEGIREDSLIAKDLGADSLDTAEIAIVINEEFGYELNDEEIRQIKTVKDLVSLILTNKVH